MKRLTMKTPDGYVLLGPIDICDNDYSKVNYEKLVNKIGLYEDLAEQGRLIESSFKAGDTAWYVDDDDDDYPIEIVITTIEIKENYILYHAKEKNNCGTLGIIEEDFGKTIFLTKEEAEKALAKMKAGEI